MHRKKCIFIFLTVLFLLSLISLSSPSVRAAYDYVDNNTSNVDGLADIGIHSNFTAQQYGPDSIYDTITEENTGGGVIAIAKVGADTSGTGTALTLSFSHTLVAGSSRLVVVCIGIENGGTIDVDSVTYGGMAMTKAIDGITGTSGYRFLAEIWYILENDLPSDGSKTVQISCSGTVTGLEVNGFCAEYTGVNQGAPEATDNTDEPSPVDATIENTISPSDDAWVVSIVGCGNSGSFTHAQGQVEVLDFADSSSTFAVAELRGASGETTLSSTYSATVNRLERVAAAWNGGVEANYELDLEVQWTNANYTQTYEELCIYGGTMGSEDIRVDVWNVSTWYNLFTDLSTGWNNISISDYLTSTVFTIRFSGGVESGDILQDIWEIDIVLLHTWSELAPVANFSFTPENPLTGETITFNASTSYDSDGYILSYEWNFGDGTNGTGEVAYHFYTDDGIYTVTLTVTDNGDLSDITSDYVTVLNRPPVAVFTESAETVYTSEPITFNATDSYDPDGVVVDYFWDFGDSSNATGIIVEHTYADDGNYTVILTVTDDDGATATASATKIVQNCPPVASFTESAETVFTGESIAFNASGSYDPDGNIASYYWDFGDGTNATGVLVNHTYADDGNYTVTLTVTDDDGATNSTTATKTVLNRPPIAIFTESAETVYVGEPITFNATDSYDPDGVVVDYFWDFGDETNATGVVVEHGYSTNGTYIVTLMVTDDDGALDLSSETKTVLWNEPPVASFTESAETVYTDEYITFNASTSYDLDGTIVGYFWDFGDGYNATSVVVDHAYADNGNYTVTLTVIDDKGATGSAAATKTVLNRPPLVSFTESAEIVLTGEAITFNASDSYDPDGFIVGYLWDFGDGTNDTGAIVEHAYADNGDYTVTLMVTDDDGAADSAFATKTVLNRSPLASFSESAEIVYTGDVITFNASGSYDPDGTIASYFWDFGDGTNGTSVVIYHSYADDGNYTVKLTVTDDDGEMAFTSSTKTVLNKQPVSIFTESAETVLTGEIIHFNASDSYDPDGSIIEYFWDLGDGTNSSGILVNHTYADDGNYTVTLTVTDDDGATNSTTATKTVLNRPPIAIFTESAETVYVGEPITFNATDSYDPDGVVVDYFWDFGDGTNDTGIIVDHSYVNSGVYTATLTVIDNDGANVSTSATKTISNHPPIAIFTYSPYPYPLVNQTVTFNASTSYSPNGVIVSYFWDLGDGTNSTEILLTHAYLSEATYTVILTVTDNEGFTDTNTQIIEVITVQVHDVAVVEVTPATTEVEKGQIINITVTVRNEGTTIETFNVTVYKVPVISWQLIEVDGYLIWFSEGIDYGDFFIITTIDVPVANPILTFETKYDFELLWDFGFVQVSRDGGITWISLENSYTTYDHYPFTQPDIVANLPGLTGTSTGWPEWMNMTFDLTDYAGETVMLGFRYMTDQSVLGEGWYVNNIRLNGNAIPNEAFLPNNQNVAIPIQTKILVNLDSGNQDTLTFTWNTTDVELNSYIIYAQITPLSGELDETDNTRTGGIVEVKLPIFTHDVAVNSINAIVIEMDNGTVSVFKITILAKNEGLSEETFNVTTYYFNATYPTTLINISTITLSSQEQATITFNWTVSDVPRGKYTIVAEASQVQGETYVDNNTPSNPPSVGVGLIGDVNGDGLVELEDFLIISQAVGSQPGDSHWNPNADLNDDGMVELMDFFIITQHFGEGW